MKTKETTPGKTYSVHTSSGCTIIDPDGWSKTIEAPDGYFTAHSSEVTIDGDDEADVREVVGGSAPSGGGAKIKFDTAPKSGSTNAVTSGGLYSILYARDVRLGLSSSVSSWGTVVGSGAKTTGFRGVALGEYAEACVDGSTAVGSYAKAMKAKGTAIGRAVTLKDEAVTAIGNQTASGTSQTIFYIIAAGSPLANKYYGDENGQNGAAFLGYVVKESNGNILECGTKKLRDLLNENTTWAPATLDLDAPAPTPFLPTGITEPIEIPEELTEEE